MKHSARQEEAQAAREACAAWRPAEKARARAGSAAETWSRRLCARSELGRERAAWTVLVPGRRCLA
eukprot:scaffold5874_cov140-Isochrysis_galbana.AAC.7